MLDSVSYTLPTQQKTIIWHELIEPLESLTLTTDKGNFIKDTMLDMASSMKVSGEMMLDAVGAKLDINTKNIATTPEGKAKMAFLTRTWGNAVRYLPIIGRDASLQHNTIQGLLMNLEPKRMFAYLDEVIPDKLGMQSIELTQKELAENLAKQGLRQTQTGTSEGTTQQLRQTQAINDLPPQQTTTGSINDLTEQQLQQGLIQADSLANLNENELKQSLNKIGLALPQNKQTATPTTQAQDYIKGLVQPQTKQSVTGWQIKRGDINDVKQMYKEAIKGTGNEKVKIILGDIPTQTKNLIKDKFGIDLTGYKRSVTRGGINHINKEHGEHTGKYAVGVNDIAKYEDITTSPDKIALTKSKDGLIDKIAYYKKDGDAYYVVEEIRTGREELSLKSMYKNKGDSKIMEIIEGRPINWVNVNDSVRAIRVRPDKQAPHLTPETLHGSPSDTIIPQNTENTAKTNINQPKKGVFKSIWDLFSPKTSQQAREETAINLAKQVLEPQEIEQLLKESKLPKWALSSPAFIELFRQIKQNNNK